MTTIPTNTLTSTGTLAGASLSATPPPTAVSTPALEELESAEYYYNGDLNLVKSVISGGMTCYVGGYSEKVVDDEKTTDYLYTGQRIDFFSQFVGEGLSGKRNPFGVSFVG